MRDDSYARFLRSNLFASYVKDDISEAGGSSSSNVNQTPSAHKPLSASSSLKQPTSSQTEGKDAHGIVSWYKTSLRPKLLRSSKKRPKPLNFDSIPASVSEAVGDSDNHSGAPSPSSTTTKSTSHTTTHSTTGSSSGSHSDSGSTHSRPIDSSTSLKKIDVIPEEVINIPIPSTSSCPSSSSHERHPHHKESTSSQSRHRHHHQVTPTKNKKSSGPTKERDSLDRFLVSPICFNLNSDRDYEEFFSDLVSSCSDRRTNLNKESLLLKDVSDLKFTSLFHSQPCLPDVSSSNTTAVKEEGSQDDQSIQPKERTKESDEDDLLMLKTCISLSPSLHDIYDQLHRPRHRHHHSKFHHHHCHIYHNVTPPPPIPPKGGRPPVPLPPPTKGSTVRRNLDSFEALYV
jgi:hypothetical protein